MSQLATSFQKMGAARDALAGAVGALRGWLAMRELLEPDAERRLELALDRLSSDRLVVACVAEFSRGKSELINAIFFSEYGRRILPSAAGRTTMCPTELMYDESLPPCIRALPIETRARLGGHRHQSRSAVEWRVFPVDTSSPQGMLEAFRLVAETVRVHADEARLYGLYDPSDPDASAAVDPEGMIEISRWRHAVINFPHPLLRDGLVIVDTPGLNAIGTEPELTLSLVPSAHAVLFVLAADTGVTRSDLSVWRHIVGEGAREGSHLAVLNKIDGLWDPLRTQAEVDSEVDRQVATVAETLRLPPARVFPVSAQKGLVAKVTRDEDLLRQSRLPALEAALVDLLEPARRHAAHRQSRDAALRVAAEVRQTLGARERGLVEQLYELRSLQGKNQGSVQRMLRRAHAEQHEFEENVRKILAARSVLGRLSDEAYSHVRLDTLRACAQETRERLRRFRLTPQFTVITRDYFARLRELLGRSGASLAEIDRMMNSVQRQFAEEAGWSLPPPMRFTLDNYIKEVDQLEASYAAHFGPLVLLTRDKWSLIERFFDTVVGQSRTIFAAAERDAEAWVRSLLPPLEMQVRDQRQQLRKRTESVTRIRDAQGSLGERITELETALEAARTLITELQALALRLQEPAAASEGAGTSAPAMPGQAQQAALRGNPQSEAHTQAQAKPQAAQQGELQVQAQVAALAQAVLDPVTEAAPPASGGAGD
jgi:hypothetical protein